MKNRNGDLVRFCIEKLGVPYVMGTNGRKFTMDIYADLTRRNPAGWFTAARLPKVKDYIGQATVDCHGLVEWFVREQSGINYDVAADAAYAAATEKGSMETIPEIPGICVRYPGHIGVYVGGGYVVEARGFDYGVCLTKLKERQWTHWYKHSKIQYVDKALPPPVPAKVSKSTSRYSIIWLQLALNRQAAAGHIKIRPLDVDGLYGDKTAAAVLDFRRHKGWRVRGQSGMAIGRGTIKVLNKQ